MQDDSGSAALSVVVDHVSTGAGATQQLSSSIRQTSASSIQYCSCSGILSRMPTCKVLSSSPAAAGGCGGHATVVQMDISMSGKHGFISDHLEQAVRSVQASVFVSTTRWPPRLLKLQLNGVTGTMAPHMTSWLAAINECIGNALMVMSG